MFVQSMEPINLRENFINQEVREVVGAEADLNVPPPIIQQPVVQHPLVNNVFLADDFRVKCCRGLGFAALLFIVCFFIKFRLIV